MRLRLHSHMSRRRVDDGQLQAFPPEPEAPTPYRGEGRVCFFCHETRLPQDTREMRVYGTGQRVWACLESVGKPWCREWAGESAEDLTAE